MRDIMKFTVLILRGSEYFVGRIKGLPAVMTQGRSEEEVMENIADALSLYLEDPTEQVAAVLVDDSASYEQIVSCRELELA